MNLAVLVEWMPHVSSCYSSLSPQWFLIAPMISHFAHVHTYRSRSSWRWYKITSDNKAEAFEQRENGSRSKSKPVDTCCDGCHVSFSPISTVLDFSPTNRNSRQSQLSLILKQPTAIQWWRSFPGRRRPAGAKSDSNDEWVAAKSARGRVSRAGLHARPPLMPMPPEVHARPVAFQFANWQPRLARFQTFGAMFWVLVMPMVCIFVGRGVPWCLVSRFLATEPEKIFAIVFCAVNCLSKYSLHPKNKSFYKFYDRLIRR